MDVMGTVSNGQCKAFFERDIYLMKIFWSTYLDWLSQHNWRYPNFKIEPKFLAPAIITFSNKLEIRGIVSSLKYSGIEDKYYTSTFLYQFVTPKAKTTFTMKHHDGDDVIIYDFNSNNYT